MQLLQWERGDLIGSNSLSTKEKLRLADGFVQNQYKTWEGFWLIVPIMCPQVGREQ